MAATKVCIPTDGLVCFRIDLSDQIELLFIEDDLRLVLLAPRTAMALASMSSARRLGHLLEQEDLIVQLMLRKLHQKSSEQL